VDVCQHSWHLILSVPQTDNFEDRRETHRLALQRFLYSLTALQHEGGDDEIDESDCDVDLDDEDYAFGSGELLFQ
jgi:hypothetical protein